MSKEEGYGKVSFMDDNFVKQELDIIDHIQARYLDNRLITVATVEDGSTILSVENPESSGRHGVSQMRLTKESLIGLLSTLLLYYEAKEINIQKQLVDAVESGKIDYTLTDNLKHPFEDGGSDGIDTPTTGD